LSSRNEDEGDKLETVEDVKLTVIPGLSFCLVYVLEAFENVEAVEKFGIDVLGFWLKLNVEAICQGDVVGFRGFWE